MEISEGKCKHCLARRMIECLRDFSTIVDRCWSRKLYLKPLHSIIYWLGCHTEKVLINVPDAFLKSLEELQTRGALLCSERRKRPRRKPKAWVMRQDAEHAEKLYYILKSMVNRFNCPFHYVLLGGGPRSMPALLYGKQI